MRSAKRAIPRCRRAWCVNANSIQRGASSSPPRLSRHFYAQSRGDAVRWAERRRLQTRQSRLPRVVLALVVAAVARMDCKQKRRGRRITKRRTTATTKMSQTTHLPSTQRSQLDKRPTPLPPHPPQGIINDPRVRRLHSNATRCELSVNESKFDYQRGFRIVHRYKFYDGRFYSNINSIPFKNKKFR